VARVPWVAVAGKTPGEPVDIAAAVVDTPVVVDCKARAQSWTVRGTLVLQEVTQGVMLEALPGMLLEVLF